MAVFDRLPEQTRTPLPIFSPNLWYRSEGEQCVDCLSSRRHTLAGSREARPPLLQLVNLVSNRCRWARWMKV
jgi:hypothetical protein